MSTPPALQNHYATRSDERAGGRRWRTVSKVLYQYYRRDMQDARDEQERMYPNNHDKHVQRTIPFVYRVARELASLYLKTPARRFLRKRDDGAGNYAAGDELPEATTDLVSRIYDGAQVTTALRHAQEVMIATGNQPILVWPMPEVGETYASEVVSIKTFGAFVSFGEAFPGLEGLCHISELAPDRVRNIEKFISVGDAFDVRVLAIDEDSGKLKLSRKAALADKVRDSR